MTLLVGMFSRTCAPETFCDISPVFSHRVNVGLFNMIFLSFAGRESQTKKEQNFLTLLSKLAVVLYWNQIQTQLLEISW